MRQAVLLCILHTVDSPVYLPPGTLRGVQEEEAEKAVQREGLALPPGMLKGILVLQEVGQLMAVCQGPPLHHTMVVHRPPMVVLASFPVLLSSATDLMH